MIEGQGLEPRDRARVVRAGHDVGRRVAALRSHHLGVLSHLAFWGGSSDREEAIATARGIMTLSVEMAKGRSAQPAGQF